MNMTPKAALLPVLLAFSVVLNVLLLIQRTEHVTKPDWPVTAKEAAPVARPSPSSPSEGETNARRTEGNTTTFSNASDPAMLDRLKTVAERPLLTAEKTAALEAIRYQEIVEDRYRLLFLQLDLAPSIRERLQQLLRDRLMVFKDVDSAAASHKLDWLRNSSDWSRIAGDSIRETESSIRGLLGDRAYSEYEKFELSSLERTVALAVMSDLSHTGHSSTVDQVKRLVDLISANKPGTIEMLKIPDPTRSSALLTIYETPVITDDTIEAAKDQFPEAIVNALKRHKLRQELQASILKRS